MTESVYIDSMDNLICYTVRIKHLFVFNLPITGFHMEGVESRLLVLEIIHFGFMIYSFKHRIKLNISIIVIKQTNMP